MSPFWQGYALGAVATAGACLLLARAVLLYTARAINHEVDSVASGKFCGNCKHFIPPSKSLNSAFGTERARRGWCMTGDKLVPADLDDEACDRLEEP